MSKTTMDLAAQAWDQTKFFFATDTKSVFVSTILFNMNFFWEPKIPTACTNGLDLYVNPDFLLSLQPDERVFLAAHEVWHVAFNHVTRLETRNPYCWNRAADHAINLMLKQQGYAVPAFALCDQQFTGMQAEDIYEILILDPENSKPFDHSDMQYQNPNTNPANVQQINNTILKASTAASLKGQGGTVPSTITSTIQEIITPVINWKVLFQRFVQMVAKVDYSFKKYNRRYFPHAILPTLSGEKVKEMVVAYDSSGSVSDDDLRAFLGQTNKARTILQPEKTTMLMFDTSVRDVKVFPQNKPAKYVDFTGRGGTDPSCVFEYLKENNINPVCLAIFSDMDFQPLDISFRPKYPVLWVSYKAYGKPEVNFGQLVIMPEEKK
jgi:predicted metal-dependent peptidase